MKKFIIGFAMMLGASMLNAKEFVAPVKESTPVDSITSHSYRLKDTSYPIYRSRRGSYYIIRISKKTGKQYREYLPKGIQKQVKQEDKVK